MTPQQDNQDNILSFKCYNCRKENIFNRSGYINGKEEIFLEAAGTPPTKEILINCKNCSKPNLIKIPLL